MAGITRYNKDTAFGLKGGNALATGDIVGCNSTGVAVKADADAPIRAVGVCLIDRTANDTRVTVTDDAEVEYPGSNFTPGNPVYLSTTAGGITQTAPNGAGSIRHPLGVAISATGVRFKICPNQFVVQAAGTTGVAFG